MAVIASHDVLDAADNVAATLDVHDSGMIVVNVPGALPDRFESTAEALDRIHAFGGTVPDLEV